MKIEREEDVGWRAQRGLAFVDVVLRQAKHQILTTLPIAKADERRLSHRELRSVFGHREVLLAEVLI